MYKPAWLSLALDAPYKPKKKSNRIKGQFACPKCGRIYIRKDSLQRHLTYECGMEPQFQCPFCPQKSQDLRVTRPWERWPSHLVLPMMLMRENMKNSMLNTSLDLSLNSPGQKVRNKSQNLEGSFACPNCGRVYKLKSSLRNHQKWECGKEPQFKCKYCSYKAKQKMHMARHMERMHRDINDKTEIKNENEFAAKSESSDIVTPEAGAENE
ncbi:unnamed protein product [Brassicogethes aeneus]|uniref:C2H2-type domain-containing protein n=1 Tax=Brassicogethes aeneus TaxID=1431903 RepID=A0A9P0AR62_BRAAE|nr:unnamed protein product [Brassicogethes aeneus]